MIKLSSCWLLTALAATPLRAAEPNSAGLEFFELKVRPLFAENCYSCHGEEKQKGKLRLDSAAAIRAGGENGPIVVPGKPDESRMILAVSYKGEDLKMPPKTRLSAKQVADLIEWVKFGAPMPASETVAPALTKKEFQIIDKDRAHWAFQPLKRPTAPKIPGRRSSVSNPIDAFILARL